MSEPEIHNLTEFFGDIQAFPGLRQVLAKQQHLQALWNQVTKDLGLCPCFVGALNERGVLSIWVSESTLTARLRLRSPEIVAKLFALGVEVSALKFRVYLPEERAKAVGRESLGAAGRRHLAEMHRMLQS